MTDVCESGRLTAGTAAILDGGPTVTDAARTASDEPETPHNAVNINVAMMREATVVLVAMPPTSATLLCHA